MIGKYVKGSGYNLILGSILASAWQDWGKPHTALRYDGKSLSQVSSSEPPKYETGVLTIQL
jgi:carbon starvation protein CstA